MLAVVERFVKMKFLVKVPALFVAVLIAKCSVAEVKVTVPAEANTSIDTICRFGKE